MNENGIISVVIAISGVTVGFLLGLLKDWIQRKNDYNERFFYEVYPKRLVVYEDVIKELMIMSENDGFFSKPGIKMQNVFKKILDDIHVLDGLRARLELYGSPVARSIISILRVEMGALIQKTGEVETDYFGQISIAFFDIVNDARSQFLEFTRKEAGANLVDKKIKKFLKRAGIKDKRKNPAKQDRNRDKPNG